MAKKYMDVSPSDIVVTGANVAGIKNPPLLNYLVHDTNDAVEDLASVFGGISLDDIRIGADGTIIIRNAAFLKLAKDTINSAVAPVAGWGCANGVCAKMEM